MLSEDDRRTRRRIWMAGSAALLAVAAVCAGWVAREIPRDIAGRTLAALQAAGLDPRAALSIDGRTVTLSGEVSDAYTRARLRAIAGAVRGVRAVRDQLAVAPLPTEPAPSPRPAHRPPPTAAPEPAPPCGPAAAAPPPEPRAETPAAAPSDRMFLAAAAASMPPMPPAGPDAGAPLQPILPLPTAAVPQEDPAAPAKPEPSSAAPSPSPLQLPRLHFQFNSTRLTPGSLSLLPEIAAALRERPEARIELAGHADAVGPRSYNQRLSLQRARVVADWLVSAGIDGARLETRGYRDSRPLMNNHSREGRAMNRRVELSQLQ